jgi:hypothetical protein
MVQYRYGLDKAGNVVDAVALRGTEFGAHDFCCVACAEPLIARVNGAKRQPHFAHRPDQICHPETYLHKLGKLVFAECFEAALSAGDPFHIELSSLPECGKYADLLGAKCRKENPVKRLYDLTAFYDQVKVESRDGGFVPDVMLLSRSGRLPAIYVEIAVTHFLSEEKAASANKIIEISVAEENDLQCIRDKLITESHASFQNFTPRELVVDAECQCHDQVVYFFMLYQGGKAYCEDMTLRTALIEMVKRRNKLLYWEIIPTRPCPFEGRDYLPEPNNAFRQGIDKAYENGIPIRNCFLCKYHGRKFDRNSEGAVYCKVHKKTCNSNAAIDCDAYRIGPASDPRR